MKEQIPLATSPLIYLTVIILGLCITGLSFLFGDDSNFNIRFLCFAGAFLFLVWWMNKYKKQ
jgi:hypothetical protein